LAEFETEAWVRVRAAASTPRRLTSVYVLDRGGEGETILAPHPQAPLALLPNALGFPGSRSRLGSQFEVLSDLVSDVPIMWLSADVGATPPSLADVVER